VRAGDLVCASQFGHPLAAVVACDDVGVEDRDQGVELAVASRREERLDDRSLCAYVHIGGRRGVCTRCRARLASWRAAWSERSSREAISSNGTANMSCRTKAMQQRVEQIKTQMRALLEWGSTGKRQRHVRSLAKNLLKLWPALWTFADVTDVEPTNNAAERGIRASVIYRKHSLGSRSQGGERTIERLLSVDQTCRLQRRSLYAYLSDALTAKARGDPVPTLT